MGRWNANISNIAKPERYQKPIDNIANSNRYLIVLKC